MLYYIHTHLAPGALLRQHFYVPICHKPQESRHFTPCLVLKPIIQIFYKDFHSQLNASEVISPYQFFFSWYLAILKSSSFVLKREAAESISTWMSELFKLQEQGLFPLEYLWVLKAKIASSCQSESMHKLFS